MSVTIAIIGASGAAGTAVAQHLLRSGILKPRDRILLVGHGTLPAGQKLIALQTDLRDAFDEDRVEIEVVPDIDSFQADIVAVAAGATLSAERRTRRDLARVNLPIFQRIAEAAVARLQHALFIVISNPVELAVEVLVQAIDRHRVIGMGAQQDSLRFARAIATDLGLSRHAVRASVFGEHGQAMVPLWQSVEVLADAEGPKAALAALEAKASAIPLKTRVARLSQEVDSYLAKGDIAAAYRAASRALPDARIFIEPRITVASLHSTPNSTANATVELIAAALAVEGHTVHGQVQLMGEVLNIEGVSDFPVTLARNGWQIKDIGGLSRASRQSIIEGAKSIRAFGAKLLPQQIPQGRNSKRITVLSSMPAAHTSLRPANVVPLAG
jgi:malate dehydrogenase